MPIVRSLDDKSGARLGAKTCAWTRPVYVILDFVYHNLDSCFMGSDCSTKCECLLVGAIATVLAKVALPRTTNF